MKIEPQNPSQRLNELKRKSSDGTNFITRCVSLVSDTLKSRLDDSSKTTTKPRQLKRPRQASSNTVEKPQQQLRHLISGDADKDHEDDEDSQNVPPLSIRLPIHSKDINGDQDVHMNESEPMATINCEKFPPSSPATTVVSCDGESQLEDDLIQHKSQNHSLCEDCTTTSPMNQLWNLHLKGVRIESKLTPMKTLLSRLMVHPTYNRKGTFNVPVDTEALGLFDYNSIIKTPMDLGTIKARLHSNAYLNLAEVAEDIRLVFNNALTYNPPSHPVHEDASHLLSYFEESYNAILQSKSIRKSSKKNNTNKPSLTDLKQLHTCQSCLGRTCVICKEKCLSLEPNLLICSGAACCGAKIARGVTYYCSKDGSKLWCQKCYITLPPNIVDGSDTASSNTRFIPKSDLLKRKSDEDVVERWITCKQCNQAMHEICAFSDEFLYDEDNFPCPLCNPTTFPYIHEVGEKNSKTPANDSTGSYSFISGCDTPQLLNSDILRTSYDSKSLPQSNISKFIESKVRMCMVANGCPTGAEETLFVRVISDADKYFIVPEVLRQHFRMPSSLDNNSCDTSKPTNEILRDAQDYEAPPESVEYTSKAIAMFQRIDGMDVCLFCMYVHEYDAIADETVDIPGQSKRVYIAYIDSVEHFRPRRLRTTVYQEIISSYLATARVRGYRYAHIWACPPSRGNSFIFWSHPPLQRIPNNERLITWYHEALSRAVNYGVITDIKSLYEFSFEKVCTISTNHEDNHDETSSNKMVCPPLLDGDYWVEQAKSLHAAAITRLLRPKKVLVTDSTINSFHVGGLRHLKTIKIPAVQVATLLQDSIMCHKSASPFCRPVNAAALKLSDYHQVIKKPMDLGTIHCGCLMGEYNTFGQIVEDIHLVFKNAMVYNPKGHFIHSMAEELWCFARKELNALVSWWNALGLQPSPRKNSTNLSYDDYSFLCMRLSVKLNINIELEANENESQVLGTIKEKDDTIVSGTTNNLNSEEINVIEEKSDNVDIITKGAEAITSKMVGDDKWLLVKKNISVSGRKGPSKKTKSKMCSGSGQDMDDNLQCDSFKNHRESWLGDEVGSFVRRLRQNFFVCYLQPSENLSDAKKEKEVCFSSYVADYVKMNADEALSSTKKEDVSQISKIAEMRQGLLEVLQFRNFQFDTLRRAKYSTAMLLYYLHNPQSSGLIPKCSKCQSSIRDVRWHKVNKAFDERRRISVSPAVRMACVDMSREELCSDCYSQKQDKELDDYVPCAITFSPE
jgi:hypothetical protein